MTNSGGFILINKDASLSSHAVLKPVKKCFATKVGHTGTLDPMATGMLVCAVGEARKFIQFAQAKANKCYQATIQLGLSTNTSDITGEIVDQKPVPNITLDTIEHAIKQQFIGRIEQTPPIYSALKYQGKPYYYYARRNESIPIQPRAVTIFSIESLRYHADSAQIHLRTVVSAGTYIRALAVDLAAALGTIGCLSQLHRVYAEPWQSQPMYTLDALGAHPNPEALLLPIEAALSHYNRITLDDVSLAKLRHGQAISAQKHIDSPQTDTRYLAFDSSAQFVGLVEYQRGSIKALRMRLID